MLLKHDKAIYLEIVDQYHQQISLGLLNIGDSLPSVRQLAYELGINPNTVSRAYKILEDEGVIEIIGQKGAFVKKISLSKDQIILKQLSEYKKQGIKKETLQNILDEIYGGSKNDSNR